MANLIDTLKGMLPGGSSRGESVLGVDIGASAIKLVQLRKSRGVAVLETYGELALGPYADLEVGRATNLSAAVITQALTDLMKEANVTTTRAAFSIPFASSLISVIDMPNLEESQLAKMIPIEARKYIPVPISEVALDWFIIPEENSGFEGAADTKQPEKSGQKTRVLLVAIHNETLNKYREVIAGAHLDSSFFEIEIFSTIRATLEQGVAPVALLDIGAATSKLYVVEYGIVKASHSINKGSQDITLALSRSMGVSVGKAERLKRESGLVGGEGGGGVSESALLVLGHIFGEANRVLLNYQKRYNKNVGTVVLTGGGAVLKGLLEHAKKSFETEVLLGNPFAKTETPAFLEEVLREAGPEFAVAVGVALRKLQELE